MPSRAGLVAGLTAIAVLLLAAAAAAWWAWRPAGPTSPGATRTGQPARTGQPFPPSQPSQSAPAAAFPPRKRSGFSAATKARVLQGLPDPMFRDVTAKLG
ncbi:MAG: hypothetical protein HY721_15615, partial [Planctomycetes bacterium]|nr:hypothetical protein [Planctomycetota bacterium]